ncbi:MAG: hypothetical protein H0T89_03705 [Deltaproteobacteria bacterium]|nr:hypothetical protein [Deltaproteobacteria bacterium]MDQ3300279.1 hypothetical protein [Myxococcota bacterium]
MPRKGLLAIGAVVVIGAVIALWLGLRTDKSAAPEAPALPSTGPTAATGDSPITPEGVDRGGNVAPPELPNVSSVPRGTHASENQPAESIVNGIRVRDHRKPEDRVPMDLPPNLHPPSSRRIQPTLTGALTDQIRKIMAACGASVPKQELGVKPRIEGQIVIAVKGQQAQVTSAVMVMRDATGPGVDQAKQCIEQKAVGVTAPAPDEADVESYSINLSFAFP